MSMGKRAAGFQAAEYVRDGMIVGFGTGSTADYFTEKVGILLQEKKLKDIVGVPTSKRTEALMREWNIPVVSLDEVERIDFLVDGADETTDQFEGIKGGGGALLYEKIVAQYSNEIIWIVTPEKLVPQLGAFPLPVEVIPFGSWKLFYEFERRGYRPAFRKAGEDQLFRTDAGNYIIDLHLEKIDNPEQIALELSTLVGVVEHGLFLNYPDGIIVGNIDGTTREILREEKFL